MDEDTWRTFLELTTNFRTLNAAFPGHDLQCQVSPEFVSQREEWKDPVSEEIQILQREFHPDWRK